MDASFPGDFSGAIAALLHRRERGENVEDAIMVLLEPWITERLRALGERAGPDSIINMVHEMILMAYRASPTLGKSLVRFLAASGRERIQGMNGIPTPIRLGLAAFVRAYADLLMQESGGDFPESEAEFKRLLDQVRNRATQAGSAMLVKLQRLATNINTQRTDMSDPDKTDPKVTSGGGLHSAPSRKRLSPEQRQTLDSLTLINNLRFDEVLDEPRNPYLMAEALGMIESFADLLSASLSEDELAELRRSAREVRRRRKLMLDDCAMRKPYDDLRNEIIDLYDRRLASVAATVAYEGEQRLGGFGRTKVGVLNWLDDQVDDETRLWLRSKFTGRNEGQLSPRWRRIFKWLGIALAAAIVMPLGIAVAGGLMFVLQVVVAFFFGTGFSPAALFISAAITMGATIVTSLLVDAVRNTVRRGGFALNALPAWIGRIFGGFSAGETFKPDHRWRNGAAMINLGITGLTMLTALAAMKRFPGEMSGFVGLLMLAALAGFALYELVQGAGDTLEHGDRSALVMKGVRGLAALALVSMLGAGVLLAVDNVVMVETGLAASGNPEERESTAAFIATHPRLCRELFEQNHNWEAQPICGDALRQGLIDDIGRPVHMDPVERRVLWVALAIGGGLSMLGIAKMFGGGKDDNSQGGGGAKKH